MPTGVISPRGRGKVEDRGIGMTRGAVRERTDKGDRAAGWAEDVVASVREILR